MSAAKIELEGAVVAVTGAGRGIGRATAALFADRGAHVCLGDLDGETAAAAARDIGPRAHPFGLDVTQRASFAEFVDSVEETVGPIDVLVNNAGIMPTGRFLDQSDETSAAILDVNVWGPIIGMKLVLPGMIERGRGHVVNVASYAGKLHIPGLAVYVASKHAVVGLTATVIDELAGTGVTATAILPSAVNTDLVSGIDFPLSRLAKVEPEEVAEAIVSSCRGRPRELSVPRWLAGYEPLTAVLPGPIEGLARRLLRDDRAISAVDGSKRAAYEERVARQAAKPRTPRSQA